MQPKARDWESFNAVVLALSGLDLDLYKPSQLRRRTLNMVETQKLAGLAAFSKWLQASPENLQWYLDKLAINVSELFRNPEKWVDIEQSILPELRKKTARIKAWSAGCSYGAEAYTLACILREHWIGNHEITATDIDDAALEQAGRGEFNNKDMTAVPDRYRKFFKQEDGVWKAEKSLKRYLKFKPGNLLADKFDSGFDLIMCRNVVIYFTDSAKEILYRKFLDSLRPGGILFVGSTERIFNSEKIGYEAVRPFFYQKPLLGARVWQNAS